MMNDFTDGLHCKACDSPLGSESLDPELCDICIGVVNELNKDLDILPEGEEEFIEFVQFDETKHTPEQEEWKE